MIRNIPLPILDCALARTIAPATLDPLPAAVKREKFHRADEWTYMGLARCVGW
jgi:hypothetical protein